MLLQSAFPPGPARAILVLGCLLALPTPLHGQQFRPDSSELHARAQKAQREFEATHRTLLPRGVERATDWCDEYVGRLCLTNGDQGWEPAEENPLVISARDSLLRVLEAVAEQIPGDRWVLGQRIRYEGDVGRWDEAGTLARTCAGGPAWWCHGLLGYVQHRSGNVLEALEAFSMALATMDPERVKEWMDPNPLLDYPGKDWFEHPGGLSFDEALVRFWTLADPLYLTPGNERLSEHYARHFAPSLYEESALTMGLPWGRAFEHLLLRYGFVAGWEQVPGEGREMGVRGVVEHHHPDSRGLLPPLEALEDPSGLPEGVWTPRDDRPRAASAPVTAPLIAQGEGQTGVLRRDGNLLVIASYGPPTDTVLHRRRPSLDPQSGTEESVEGPTRGPPWESSLNWAGSDTVAGLFLLADTGQWAPLAVLGEGGEGVFQLLAPPGGYLLSLEQWAPAGRWGARVRHGVRGSFIPPDVPHLSDLLILEPGGVLPETLSEAIPRLRSSTAIQSEARLTVVWEVYGLGRKEESLTFRISLVKEGESLVRRALQRIGLFRKAPALSLSWDEVGPIKTSPLFRAVDLEMPPLDAGSYVLRLEMEMPFRSVVLVNRRITVS